MIEQTAIRTTLLEELSEIRARNPMFSMRAFARRLKVSPSTLSEILNGKRRITSRQAVRFMESLEIPEQKKTRLLELFSRPSGEAPALSAIQPPAIQSAGSQLPLKRRYQVLDADHFAMVADWQNFAVLSLAETEGFRAEPEWIAKRLGLTTTAARVTLERLLKMNLLRRHGRTVEATGESYASPDGIPLSSIKQNHAESLRMAESALFEYDSTLRDFTSLTVTFDPERIQELKKAIRDFRDKLGSFCESTKKKEVYRLAFQFYPLSKPELSKPTTKSEGEKS